MELKYVLLILVILCAFWNVAASIRIYDWFRRRQVQVSFIWLKVLAPVYAHRYQKITLEETGHTGPLYYHWLVSIVATGVLAVIALLLHFAG